MGGGEGCEGEEGRVRVMDACICLFVLPLFSRVF